MSVVCGPNSDLFKVIVFYVTNPGTPIDRGAVTTAWNFISDQLEPVKDEMKSEVISIGFAVALMLVFIVMFAITIYILWICYELNVSAISVIIILMILFAVSAIVYILASRRAVNVIETIIDKSLSSLSEFSNEAFELSVLGTINNAASVYLSEIGQSC